MSADPAPAVGQGPSVIRSDARLILLAALLASVLLAAPAPVSVNDQVNVRTITALTTTGGFAIDLPTGNRDDVIRVGEGFYSARPPVLAWLSAFPSRVLGVAAGALGAPARLYRTVVLLLTVSIAVLVWRRTDPSAPPAGGGTTWRVGAGALLAGAAAYGLWWRAPPPDLYPLLVASTSGLLGAASASLLWREARVSGLSPRSALALVAVVTLGSMVTVYTTVLNHHTTAGALLLLAVAGLLRWRREGTVSPVTALGIGVALGLAPTIDVAGGGIFLLCLGPLAVWRPGGAMTALGIALAGGLHVVLNLQVTGGLVPALVQPELFDVPGSRQTADQLSGLWQGHTWSERLVYAARLLAGRRGLLVYSPVVVPALVAAWRVSRVSPYWRELRLLVVGTVLHVAYTIEFTDNLAGACYGIRWFVLALPAWWLVLGLAWPALRRPERLAVTVCGAYGGYVAWFGVAVGAWQPAPVPLPWPAAQALVAVALAGLAAVMWWGPAAGSGRPGAERRRTA